ncbi:PGF-pre-PGF domain-containing protein [Methanofollis sp. W23]|uniref:NosD domain-containing protein n=1 Tax=Methanofollis sp. W23 TaxID=2817849 RepID=UPI001AE0F3FF|nr:NosD domain-containing protein [Methanofollis sp. W23]MBP2144794.1 PGF-pre-PGF domain-containing protein [Methanofollis sp. W23]
MVYNYLSLFYHFQEGTSTNDQHFFRRFSETINRTALAPFFGILLLALALASPPVAATDWTVGSDGCNFTTIGAALSNTSVTAGDVILIHPGTYDETVNVGKRLTLRGEAGATVNGGITIIADGATVENLAVNGATDSMAIYVNRADDAVVRGCTISSARSGIYIESATNCTVERCVLDDTITDTGIYLYSSSDQCRILDNTVTGCGSLGIALLNKCRDCVISGNTVQDCGYAGIQIQGGCEGSVVVANTFSENIYGVVVMDCTGQTTILKDNTVLGNRDRAVYLTGTDSVIVENVTVRGGEYGVCLSSVGNITLANSTITGTGTGLYVESTTTDSLIANNLFNNTKNIGVRARITMTGTRWNTTKAAGENIRGGSFLGGNLWLTPEGTGFSQTHADFDLDGICEEGYAITDKDGMVVGTDSLPLQNGGPSANFTIIPSSVMIGVPVFFNDTSVGTPTSWSWAFGDETETTRNVTRIYDTAGTYQATLTVANEFGTNTTARTVTIEPFSIQGAVDAASKGDVVVVPSGTYDETVNVNKTLTLRGSEGATVNGSISLTAGAAGATIEHLTVNGAADTTPIVVSADDAVVRGCTVSGGPEGIFLFYATNCTVEGCTVSGGTTGINLYSSGQCRILDNRVAGSGDSGIHLYNICPECVISGNIVHDCGNTGISLWAGSQGSEVVANTCSDNEFGFVVSGCTGATTTLKDNTALGNSGPGIVVSNSGSVVIENVTVHENQCGFRLSNSETVTLTNSTLTGTTGSGLEVNSASSSLIANNLFNNTKNINIWSDTGLTGTRWNTTKTFRKNIRGGPFLGGNLWLTPEGTGFSETHKDLNGDGICDEGYDLGNGCTDSLPLHTCLPTADFTFAPTGGSTPLEVQFTEICSGVNPRLYHWDFGDNTPAVEFVHPSHTFTTNGSHQVSLTVTNAFGSDTVTKTVTTLDPPTANFTVTPAGGKAPLTVVCTDASTGCVSTRLWDFGDGTTSTEATPTHVYAKAGTYTVSLNVSNPYASNTTVRENCITVEGTGVSSGGGGGRSPASAGAASHIPASGHASFEVRDAAIAEVEVTAAELVSHILVTVEPIAKPNHIKAPADAVYEYDEVTLYHTTDEAIASADLAFTVPKTWLKAQGARPDDVVLYRYHDGAWHALLTERTGEDKFCYSFTARSSGFSLFAIGVDESGPAPTVTPTETVTAVPATTAPPTTAPHQTPMPSGIVFFATGAAFILAQRLR